MHHMFAEALEHPNVNLQTNTPVKSIAESPTADGRWKVTTNRGTVLARQVIMATNAYTAALLPEYRNKIIPYRAICSRIVEPSQASRLTNTYALRFNEWDFDYLIPRTDGSIIVGGARRAYLRNLEDWYDNVNDEEVITRARGYFDGYMQRNFHGWENSKAYTEQVWTGSKFSKRAALRGCAGCGVGRRDTGLLLTSLLVKSWDTLQIAYLGLARFREGKTCS